MAGRELPVAAPDVALYMYRVLREDTAGTGGSAFAVETAIVTELSADLQASIDQTRSPQERAAVEQVIASAQQLRDAMAAADTIMAEDL